MTRSQQCAPSLVWFPNPLAPEIHVRWATVCFTSLTHLLLLFHIRVMCNSEHCWLNNRVRHISRICSKHADILRSNTSLWPLDIFCIAHHLTLGLYVIRCNTVGLSSLLHEVIGHYYGTSSPRVSNKGKMPKEQVSAIHSLITFLETSTSSSSKMRTSSPGFIITVLGL